MVKNFSGKKILITGGAGFIGSEFVRQGVNREFKMVVVDKFTYAGDLERLKGIEDKMRLYRTDITNREFLEYIFKKERPDAVVHCAAESHVDRSILDASPFLSTNVVGTQTLLEISKDSEIEKFINISTDEVYGDLKENGEFYETTLLNPNSPYSVSKASADMLGRAYLRTYNVPVITVRPSNNYGPWQYPEKLIPLAILKILNNEKIPIYGTGQNVREWLYVSDCADAVFDILERGKVGEIYNVGSGEEEKNIDVVKNVLKLLGKPEDLIEFTKDRLGHDFRYSLNSAKIEKTLGWQSVIPFNVGLEKTVKWYLGNIRWLNSKLDYLNKYWDTVYKGNSYGYKKEFKEET